MYVPFIQMKNWRQRKVFHRDGNQACIKLSKSYSLAFDTYLFKLFFNTLFNKKNGSLFWKTLSLKKKLFDKNYGLGKFFTWYYSFEKRPYHGINYLAIQLSFINLYVNHYFDEKELENSNFTSGKCI
jgi:hypothetical protein